MEYNEFMSSTKENNPFSDLRKIEEDSKNEDEDDDDMIETSRSFIGNEENKSRGSDVKRISETNIRK